MKSFCTQPRLQYFILSSLILSFLGGVTSHDVVINKYKGPVNVHVGDKVRFTGTVNSTTGSYPKGVSFFIITTNAPPDERVCNMYFGVCDSTLNDECYCNKSNGDTYDFVILTNATFERSEGILYASIGGNRPIFPKVIARPSQSTPVTSTTITTTPGTSTGSTDVINDNVTFTTVTTGVGGDSVSPTVTLNTTPQIDTTDGPSNNTGGQNASDDDDCDCTWWIIIIVVGVFVLIAILVVLIYVFWWKKKKCAAVTSDQPSDSPAEEASTVHSTNHNALTSSKPEDKVEMTGEKKKKKNKKSTKAGSPKKKKKDFENGEKKMDENEPRCLPQPEPVAEPGLSTSLSNPEALKSNFATTRLSSPPSNTRPTSIEMTSAPRPLPSPRNPNM